MTRLRLVIGMILGFGTTSLGPITTIAFAQQSAPNNASWTDSITSPFKHGFEKLGQAIDPDAAAKSNPPEDEALSLKKQAKPGPELYVAIARLYERAGNFPDAEKQYQAALQVDPDYMPALLGYAQWKEQNGKSNEALQLYLKAADKYPKEASVHNNLGLYYARNHRLDEAAASMRRAIQIEPKNTRYRNNIATILVDQGQWREAYSHLSEVYSAAVAHYNLGYLLNKKGQTQAALQNFSLAVQADPSMEAARRWVEHLQRTTTQARLPNHPMANGVRITTESIATAPKDPSRPMSNPEPPGTAIASKTNAPPTASTRHPVATTPIPSTEDTAPMPPDGVPPRRLPPTTVQDQPDAQGPSLPGISYQRSSRPMAPLPPITEALRPLPRVN